ncbi:GNAT family N-acetyltransferase, partial [Candidatus Cardinium sp. cBcalN2]|uniref:GNAT family N-acetyltransferase n=1 Tax=Candidatus Cardinium sp. cBcalN2 TaxID=2699436 RepID=UPI0034E02CEB
MGYWIGEAFQGLGIVTSACAKLVAIGFHQLALNVIAIRCAIDNRKSQNIPIRLGFKKSDSSRSAQWQKLRRKSKNA